MGEWLAVQRRNDNFQISCLLASTIGLMIFQRPGRMRAHCLYANSLCLHPDLHRTVYLFCIMLPFALVVDLLT